MGNKSPNPQHWLQVTLTSTAPELAEEVLLEAGAQAITLRDAADQALLEPLPGETPLWDNVRITGLFDSDQAAEPILSRLKATLGETVQIEVDLLEDRAWVRAWMEHFEPLQFGDLWICPSHREVQQPGATVIRLDPGMAFGTGTHPTTAMCLRWLGQAAIKGKTVIDYGCGSGILAIAAARLGATRVWAVDIDPQALDACAANAETNQCVARIRCCHPEQLPKTVQADLLIANILAGPLIELAPVLNGHLRKSAQLVLAGLLQEQMDDCVKAYSQHLALQAVFSSESWVLLAGEKGG